MATKFLPLILSSDTHEIVEWWIDASFVAIHDNMENWAGLCMSIGKGTIYVASIKHTYNATSSTKAALVGFSDGMPKMAWIRCFIHAQGYNVENTYIYQEYQSAIILETNGMRSVGKNS